MPKDNLSFERIFDFEKNRDRVGIDLIEVTQKDESKKPYCGIRELYQKDKEWLPSQKGLTFPYDQKILDDIIEATDTAIGIDKYSEEGEVLYEFEKNSKEKVFISVTTFRNQEYMDIRSYFLNKEGEYKPSKRGITIPPDCLDDLKEGLLKLKERMEN